jgi:hypothetical protein
MEGVCSSKTLVLMYQIKQCHNSFHSCECLKSDINFRGP